MMKISDSVLTNRVTEGSTAVLNCGSNDDKHNFLFWLFDTTKVIGPGIDYDDRKYKYHVLSGKLHIHSVSSGESGYYNCISRHINGSGYNVDQVDLVVSAGIDVLKICAIIISLLVIFGCAITYYRLRKEWSKYEGRTIVAVDDNDEEEGDEIYNSTTTTKTQPVAGPSRNVSSDQLLYGIENQGLDTDFNSVFENIQVKSPQMSLI